MSSKLPSFLVARVLALVLLLGAAGGGTYVVQRQGQVQQVAADEARQALADFYVRAVAADTTTSVAVKLAMVLGHFFESSGEHIGTPYTDRLGRGQPLTVCNGITGVEVVAGHWYSPADCYELERRRYLSSEHEARHLLRHWESYDAFTQAVFIDFIHNKGPGALAGSTMLRKANAGDLEGACRENPRWNKGTVGRVRKVLPGLQLRGDANDEMCRFWRLEQA